MDLNIVWFILIAVLFIGYFVLEGFDMGVGILLPFIAKTDIRRRVVINTIGPHWDGNEVWLLTAGGAMFAAFPHWYATVFSGFYLPLFLILIGLILRGAALEFRSKDENPKWRSLWDWAIFVGSLLPALLWGVAFADFILGVPVDASKIFAGTFFDLIPPLALLGGVVSLLMITFHGAIFLSLKTTEPLSSDARRWASRLWLPALIALALFVGLSLGLTDILAGLQVPPALVIVLAVLAVVAMLAAGLMVRQKRDGTAFIAMVVTILLSVATIFVSLFPRVLVSSLDPAFSLTIYTAASGPATLKTMSIVALILVPIVLAYQGWSYWIFRKRLSEKSEALHY